MSDGEQSTQALYKYIYKCAAYYAVWVMEDILLTPF